jgi:hypothetical protein
MLSITMHPEFTGPATKAVANAYPLYAAVEKTLEENQSARRSVRLREKAIKERQDALMFVYTLLKENVAALELTTCSVERVRLCTEFLETITTRFMEDKTFAKHFYSMDRIQKTLLDKCTHFMTKIMTTPSSDSTVNTNLITVSNKMRFILNTMKSVKLYYKQ